MTAVILTTQAAGKVSADAVVVAATSTGDGPRIAAGAALTRAVIGHLQRRLAAVGADGGVDEVTRLGDVTGVAAPVVVVVGTGPADQGPDPLERLRRAAGTGTRALAGRDSAVLALGDASAEQVQAVAEGAVLGAYSFQTFLGAGKAATAKAPLGTVTVPGPKASGREGRELLRRVEALSAAVRYARDLVNTPPNVLYPESFATSVQRHAAGSPVSVQVWDEERLLTEGCGGILGVGQGSGRGPRLVLMSYTPRKPVASLAFVGKGITFDSGGLCIKPGTAMVTMKCDMAGAAAVAAAVQAIARLELPVAVTGYLCLAENMTGDLAQRPGDVVTMRGGTTVEIINTDAEGRLVMADGLALASERTPDAIIDIATLTGAQVVALGTRTFAVMGNDEALRSRVHDAATGAGESAWPMPLPEEIRATIDSPVADVKHTGEKAAGMMTAAVFLQQFVGQRADGSAIPWAHVDIAGPAFNDAKPWGYTPKGGTGAGVRTLVALAQGYAG